MFGAGSNVYSELELVSLYSTAPHAILSIGVIVDHYVYIGKVNEKNNNKYSSLTSASVHQAHQAIDDSIWVCGM